MSLQKLQHGPQHLRRLLRLNQVCLGSFQRGLLGLQLLLAPPSLASIGLALPSAASGFARRGETLGQQRRRP